MDSPKRKADELDLVDIPKFVNPCEKALEIIRNHGSRRQLSLSDFKQTEGHCVWCGVEFKSIGLTSHPLRRWCPKLCVASAQLICYPNDPGSKMHRLIFDQNFACKGCGEDFEHLIRKKIRSVHRAWNSHRKNFTPIELRENPMEKISLHRLGYGTGDIWQTDHIIPVHQGGKGIDPDNLQVLCVRCHREKTCREVGARQKSKDKSKFCR